MLRRLHLCTAVSLIALGAFAPRAAAMTMVYLENGMRLFYEVRPASGLVASAVLVAAGAAEETQETNGAAHFLEHLLYDGTKTRTQEVLAHDFDLIGAYSNATTRRDHVAYLVVAGGEDLQRALELQADMLFHSTLPPDQFEKERGIIQEEIAKDASAPGAEAERALTELLAGDGKKELPILGTKESIAALTRDQVLAYYREHYVPNQMTLVVLGDFVPDSLLAAVARHFGKPRMEYIAEQAHWGPPTGPSGIYQRPLAGDEREIRLRTVAGLNDRPVPALRLVTELLNGETGALATALRAEPAIANAEAEASLHTDFHQVRLEIAATCDTTTSVEAVQGRLVAALRQVAAGVPPPDLAAARTRYEVSTALAADEIHYVAFTRADWFLGTPFDIWADEAENVATASLEAVKQAATALLKGPAILAAVGPGLAPVATDRNPFDLVAGSVTPATADFAVSAASPESLAVDPDWKRVTGTQPPLPRAAGYHGVVGRAAPVVRTFPNGLTAIVAASPESEVFAIQLLARGRSFCEPIGKSGVADLVHRLMPYGAGGRSREQVGADLDRAGIRLKLTDDPSIPYDDYQTTPSASFIRLETVDRFGSQAIALLHTMVASPDLDAASLDEVKRQAVLEAERRAHSPADQSLAMLRVELFQHSPGARPALGTVADLKSITVDDLRDFHRHYFDSSNLILAVVTGIEPEAVLARIAAAWDVGAGGGASGAPRVPSCADPKAMGPPPTTAPDKREQLLGKEQSWIREGTAFTVAPADRGALEVATLLLSERMNQELRERQGLAYSVGATLGTAGDHGWLIAGMGTRPENLESAATGLTAAIRSLGSAKITAGDVARVVKAQQGRLRMRRVTRINQAQALAYDALNGDPPGSSAAALSALAKVRPEDVSRVARAYFSKASLVTAIAR
jgi:zinc protease